MSEFSFIEYCAMGLVIGPIAVYMVARLSTAAYFNSKQHYERQQNDRS